METAIIQKVKTIFKKSVNPGKGEESDYQIILFKCLVFNNNKKKTHTIHSMIKESRGNK